MQPTYSVSFPYSQFFRFSILMAGIRKHLLFILIVNFFCSANTQAVVCSCDLIGNACDANCCCDTECNGQDVAAFVCSDATVNQDSKLCVNNLVFVNNRPSTSVVEDAGVFCIVRDSDTSRNFYNEPTLLNTTEEFDAAIAQYPTYSYDFTLRTPSSGPSYVTGDTIDIVHASGLRGKFGIPTAGVASNCIDGNPASFMTDQSVGCARRFASLPCAAGSVLDPSVYYSPSTFQISAKPISNTSEATLVNITLCNSTESIPAITMNGTNCLNAALEVSYTISYNGTSGISSACVSFTQGTVSGTSLFQSFKISFIAIETVVNTTFSRSGNPGYLVGKPLRTSLISSGNRSLVTDQLTLLSTEDGSCASPSTSQQIAFGEDQRTGCLLSFTRTTSCNDSLTRVRSLLNVMNILNVEVATFGNISIDADGDWVPMTQRTTIEVSPTTDEFAAGDTFGTGCASFPTGVNYYVFFANFGSISNPQAKIVGVQYQEIAESLAYECNTAECSDGSSERYVEISTSVTFIDMSSTPVTILKERPTVDARLPDDFFFPFTST